VAVKYQAISTIVLQLYLLVESSLALMLILTTRLSVSYVAVLFVGTRRNSAIFLKVVYVVNCVHMSVSVTDKVFVPLTAEWKEISEQLDEATKGRILAQNEAGEAKSELVIIQVLY